MPRKNKYDENGFDELGFDKNGRDKDGYNKRGYDIEGYDRNGFNRYGKDKEGYNREGYNKDGRDREGFDEFGFDIDGYDKQGFDENGIDREGYNTEGFNSEGVDRQGFNTLGVDKEGYNKKGFNNLGWNREHINEKTNTKLDPRGITYDSLDANGNSITCFYVNGLLSGKILFSELGKNNYLDLDVIYDELSKKQDFASIISLKQAMLTEEQYVKSDSEEFLKAEIQKIQKTIALYECYLKINSVDEIVLDVAKATKLSMEKLNCLNEIDSNDCEENNSIGFDVNVIEDKMFEGINLQLAEKKINREKQMLRLLKSNLEDILRLNHIDNDECVGVENNTNLSETQQDLQSQEEIKDEREELIKEIMLKKEIDEMLNREIELLNSNGGNFEYIN